MRILLFSEVTLFKYNVSTILSPIVAKNTSDKYRKNRKNYRFNKILDLEKEETKKGPEMSANMAKIAKVTRIFLAG